MKKHYLTTMSVCIVGLVGGVRGGRKRGIEREGKRKKEGGGPRRQIQFFIPSIINRIHGNLCLQNGK